MIKNLIKAAAYTVGFVALGTIGGNTCCLFGKCRLRSRIIYTCAYNGERSVIAGKKT